MLNIFRAAAAFIAAGLLGLNPASAQSFDWHKFSGLPFGVSAVAFDASGGKWVASGGLAHFDGTRWTNYDSINTNGGLISDKVTTVFVDRVGNVWAGMESGVSKFDGKQWTRYTASSTGGGLSAGQVNGIAQDRNGDIWFSIERNRDNEGGVSRFDGRAWTHWGRTGKPLPCDFFGGRGIAIDSNDVPWLALGDCVASFDGARWNKFDKDNTANALQGAFSVAADRQGGVWFGGIGYVTRHAAGRWTLTGPYTDGSRSAAQNGGIFSGGRGDPRQVHFDRALTVDGDGNLWAAASATDNPASLPGLFRYDGSNWRRYYQNEQWRFIYALGTDLRGKVWVGVEGLQEFDGSVRTTYNPANTLAGPPPDSELTMGLDGEGNVWAGGTGAASLFNGRQWSNMARGLPDSMTVEQVTGRGNTTWVSLSNTYEKVNAIARRTGTGWTVFRQADLNLQLGRVWDMATDSKGQLWAATENGLLRHDGTRWSLLTTQNTNGGLPSNSVRAVTVDARDQVWVGSTAASMLSASANEGGVSRFDGTNWTSWTAATTNGGLATNNIRNLRFDSKGRLWADVGASLALRNLGGLAVFDGSNWRTLTAAANPQLESGIRGITPDAKGGLWMATENGALWFDGERSWQRLTRTNLQNALPGNDVGRIVVDRAQNVWFAVKDGGLAVLKADGQPNASTARPLPLRVAAQEPRFAEQPELAARNRLKEEEAAKAKAEADKARADAANARATLPQAQLQKNFCEAFKEVRTRAGLNQLLADHEGGRFPVDSYTMSPVCELSGEDNLRGPVIHYVIEDYSEKSSVLTGLYAYYTEKRKDEAAWLKVINARDAKGRTMLDYIDSLAEARLIEKSKVARLVRYVCGKGAVYAKGGNCP